MSAEPSRGEKKTFLRVLSSLAWADGVVADEELQVLHLAASDLQVALSERDLEARDLEALAGKIAHPLLRAKLLEELARLAEADANLAPEELATIKFFAERWELSPPHLPDVDWDQVEPAS
jgi:uncharacterized tellurite resistance protein B-like protein